MRALVDRRRRATAVADTDLARIHRVVVTPDPIVSVVVPSITSLGETGRFRPA